MKLYLVKPDLTYFEKYNEMMREWCESNTRIAPWFLDEPIDTIEEFEKLIKLLDDCEHGLGDSQFASTTSFFVVDENNKLIGATSLRHYLTCEGYRTWGHIGFGVRPSERRKGYATQMLKMMLEEAKKHYIYIVLIGCYADNVGSYKTIEKCGGILEDIVSYEAYEGPIKRYWINLIH
ncbi:MAG: GNAT family N-acetyltransferase [Lachnospiraceae bacterium]|nr:GNAT family N-acetyltransferase [Lachnospiraceae bacterium]